MYFNDMEIKLGDQNPDCYNFMPLNLLLVLFFIYTVHLCIQNRGTENHKLYVLLAIFAYILMVAEGMRSRTAAYLSNIKPADYVTCHINEMKMKSPQINYFIENYHTEDNPNDSEGTIRVVTHAAREPFRFSEYLDKSPDASAVEYMRATKLCRINFGVCIDYTAQSSQSFAC